YQRIVAASTNHYLGLANSYSATACESLVIPLTGEMRAVPTPALSAVGHLQAFAATGGAGTAFTGGTINLATKRSVYSDNLTGSSGLTPAGVCTVYFNNTAGWISADARL